MTLQLLWEEYAKDNALAYKYTSFCVKYREWALGLKRSMRQTHIAGEKLFVDYAGQTVPIVDATTGEITQAQIFVATFGASNYTYACATARQTTADWIGAQVQALEFFGGVPRLIVPDQARALIKNPDTYETLSPTVCMTSSLPTMAALCWPPARPIPEISPRWRTPCWWWSAGFWPGCAIAGSSTWWSSIRPSPCCWST